MFIIYFHKKKRWPSFDLYFLISKVIRLVSCFNYAKAKNFETRMTTSIGGEAQ